MTPDWPLIWFFWQNGGRTLAFVVCTWALIRGQLPERLGAVTIAVSWLLSYLNARLDGSGPADATVAIDVVTAVCFGALALWSRRPWTFFIAACMVNLIITHLVARSLGLGKFAYVTLCGFWGGYALCLCLAAGVWACERSRRASRPA